MDDPNRPLYTAITAVLALAAFMATFYWSIHQHALSASFGTVVFVWTVIMLVEQFEEEK